jgi:hypothetical protein
MEITAENIIKQKFSEFIGRWNIVLKLKGDWYEIPFKFLWEEFVISEKTDPSSAKVNIEAYLIMDMVTNELLSRWDYFEPALRNKMIEKSKLRRK